MSNELPGQTCKQCGLAGAGKYCTACGQSYTTKRITLHTIIHEVFHFFSHLDKGFPYTLKTLITSPGNMQREYMEGHRSKHQKPFSMFFLCATIAALMYYWINLVLVKYYQAGNVEEVSFFHQYMVILQVVMLPVYALVTYIFFLNSKYNYAEVLVLNLYAFSVIILLAAILQLLKFIWPGLESRYIELPLIVLYTIITNTRFFNDTPKWMAITKSILSTSVCFFLASFIQDWLIEFLSR